jgi:RNA polymerase sigma-70 factor (ECF subfamily)
VVDESETSLLVRRAADGDQQAWSLLLGAHRDRLLDGGGSYGSPAAGRIDPSDVIQEACAVAAKQISAYAANPAMPFYLWLRWITGQRLIDQHRRHLGTKARGANREVSHFRGEFSETTSANLAAQIFGNLRFSQNAIRGEQTIQLQEALMSLDPLTAILALRHFEQLSNGEVAEVLGLDKSAASKTLRTGADATGDVLLPQIGSDLNCNPGTSPWQICPQPNVTVWKSWQTIFSAIALVNVPASRTTSGGTRNWLISFAACWLRSSCSNTTFRPPEPHRVDSQRLLQCERRSPQLTGDFLIAREIGRGGMGVALRGGPTISRPPRAAESSL